MTLVGEVLDLAYGKALKASDRSGGDIPVVGSGGVVGGHDVGITGSPTIVVGRKGSIGSVTWIDGPAWPIDTAYYVRPKRPDVDFRWAYWMLRSLHMETMNKSAAVPGLNRDDVYRLAIDLPPLEEQRRIAAILDKADAIRAKRRRVLAQLDDLTQAIFHDMFGDPATNPHGFPVRTIRSIAAKFSDGPFGSNLKSSHYTNAGVPVIRLQNIGVGRYLDGDRAFVSDEHYSKLAKHDCRPGDIIIGTLGDPNLRACIQPPEMPIALNKADCIQFRPNSEVADAQWACWLLNMPGTLSIASSLAHGQTRTRIAMGQLREMRVPVPPLHAQREFAGRIAELDRVRTRAEEARASEATLLASLQSRAFKGAL